VSKRCGNSAIGEHRALTVWFNDNDDGWTTTCTLKQWLHARFEERSIKGITCCVRADRADEAGTSTGSRCGDRDICGAPTASTDNFGSGITSTPPRGIKANGDFIDQVTDTDD
jgi:hypothetical protein